MFSKIVVSGLLCLTVLAASATEYPDKPITLVVPFPPGSTSDLIPRLLAPIMSKSMGTSVIIENRPGANGSLGAVKVAASPGDGYTVLMATTGVLAINQWIYKKPLYSASKDFTPVINAASTPNMLVVHPSVKANNLQELIKLAKGDQNKLTYASAGNGSTSHLCGETLNVAAGIKIEHIPYQGPAPAIQDVLSGRVSMMCDNLSNVIQYVNSGKLRAIVVTSTEPNVQAPQVPTSVQAGLPELKAGIWYGFVVPSATPKAIVDRLNAEFAKALRDPTVSTRLTGLGLTIVADKPEEFKEFVAQESNRMRKIVETSGASIQ